MFDNPGKKIKNYAEWLFSANIIIAVIWLIKYVASEIGHWEWESFTGMWKIAVYVCSAYLLSLFLTAFGELVENSGKWKCACEKNIEEPIEEPVEEQKTILTAKEKADMENAERSKRYLDANILFYSKKYKDAKALFETVRGYKDANEKILECENNLGKSLFEKIKDMFK